MEPHTSTLVPPASGRGWSAILRHVLIAVATTSLAGMSLVTPAPAAAAFPGSNGLIAFQSSRASDNYDIWVMDGGGGSAARLTTDPAEDTDPAFSPDGSKIAFQRYDGGGDVYVMNVDGSDQTVLAEGYDPAWTPDGRLSYAFRSDIWTMDADGGNQQLLVASGSHPAWSPDGTKVAFVRGQNMFIAAADGSGATQIASYADDPNWAPDGSRIAYTRWAVDPGIAIVNPDGTGLANLTHGDDFEPAFSPDGTRIVFTSGSRADNYELFTTGSGGGSVTRLTNEFPAYDAMADWQAAPPLPELAIADTTVTEGNAGTTDAVFEVTLSKPSATTVSVRYATADGSAIAPDDYAQTSGTLILAPGETAGSITVPVVGDTFAEPDKTFSVLLSGPIDATITDDTAAGTIVDDDQVTPTAYELSISDTTAKEKEEHGRAPGASGAVFVVSLNAPAGEPIRVEYATIDGTATAPADYEATAGHITFGPGQRQATIHVRVNRDNLLEGDETFTVQLSNARGADIVDGVGVATIIDDDPRPTADLGVSIRDRSTGSKAGAVLGGAEVEYAVAVWNQSRLSAVDAIVTVTLPAGFSFVSAQMPACAAADDAGRTVVTCPLSIRGGDNGAGGRGGGPEFSIRTLAGPSSGAYSVSAAIALAPGVWAVDPRPGDNASATETLVGPVADLAVSLGYTASDSWMVGIANNGPDFSAATVTINLPEGFTFLSSTHAACAGAGPVVTCSLPPIHPGAKAGGAGFDVQLRVPQEHGQYTVSASVAPAGTPLPYDPRPDNNQAVRTVSTPRR